MATREERRNFVAARRAAAFHEGAHIVIARSFGYPSWGSISPTWIRFEDGSVSFADFEGVASWNNRVLPVTLQYVRRIKVAGAVGEHCLWESMEGSAYDHAEPDIGELYEAMSPEDRMAGPDGKIITDILDLSTSTLRQEQAWQNAALWVYRQINPRTGKLWPDLCREVRQIIVESRGVEGRVVTYGSLREAA